MEELTVQDIEEKYPKWMVELALNIKKEIKKQIKEGTF